jgi:hypothetical protein
MEMTPSLCLLLIDILYTLDSASSCYLYCYPNYFQYELVDSTLLPYKIKVIGYCQQVHIRAV